jgi:toxin YhaV
VSTADGAPLVVHGWRIYAHPLFLDQLELLITEVEVLRRKDPEGYGNRNASKRLAAVTRLMLRDIPQDPTRKEYQQGWTLGVEHRHWRRVKFFQQYRLFFRFHSRSKLIVLGWVNDTGTKRAYGSRGHPPNDWEELMAEVVQTSARMQKLTDRLP